MVISCKSEGCDREARVRGLCKKHYQAFRKGSEFVLLPKPTLEEKFWSRTDRRTDDECWLWNQPVTFDGYVHISYDKVTYVGHRLSYEWAYGPIPEGLEIDHLCHWRDMNCSGGRSCLHRRCVNPAHLEAVTKKVNSERTVLTRRTACPRGHPYDMFTNWGRKCRRCMYEAVARYQARLAGSTAPEHAKMR